MLVASIYLPNGNPQPGPKFDYKLAWFERLIAHAAGLHAAELPVVLAGDYNVVPTDADIYPTTSWAKDALLQPAPRAAFRRLLDQGWTDALRARHAETPLYTFWDYKRQRWPRAMLDCGWTTCCSARSSPHACARLASTVRCVARTAPATTRRPGSACIPELPVIVAACPARALTGPGICRNRSAISQDAA